MAMQLALLHLRGDGELVTTQLTVTDGELEEVGFRPERVLIDYLDSMLNTTDEHQRGDQGRGRIRDTRRTTRTAVSTRRS